MKKSPVIIIGMSRSGTSMLTRMLEDLGLFVGNKVTSNHEAVFFRDINRWLLEQCSGGLENAVSVDFLLRDSELRSLFADFINYVIKTPRCFSYLGFKKYFRYFTPFRLDIPWGWKDPRNTYTLPFWLDIFPSARVVHITRHGVDVANSLYVRRQRGLERLKYNKTLLKPLYRLYLMRKTFTDRGLFVDVRCNSLESGISLWEEYMEKASEHVENLGKRAIEFKYEDLVLEPGKNLGRLSSFLGLNPSSDQLNKAKNRVNKSRAYAYKNSPELSGFAGQIDHRLKAYGYES